MTKHAVIITGANGGIGAALCAGFQDAGYYVIATDLQPSGQSKADYYLPADLQRVVTNKDDRQDFFTKISAGLKGHALKGLINNAAVQRLSGLDALDIADFNATMSVNVAAPLVLSQLFLGRLEAAHGSIVNIGSIHARLTKPAFISYATSKAALQGLTQALAIDLGGRVRVNAIAPAATETEMLVAGFKGKEQSYQQLKNYHPVRRIAQPEEIAAAAIFLVSDQCGFMTGATMNIDGGIGCRLHDPD